MKKILLSSKGVSKPLVITIVAIVALLLLASLIFFSDRFVGKAISFTPTTEFSGVGVVDKLELPIKAGEQLKIKIGATLTQGQESVAYKFQLKYPSNLLQYVGIDSALDEWGNQFLRDTSTSGMVKFEHATIDPRQSIVGPKSVYLAEITFNALSDIDDMGQLSGLIVDNVDVMSLSTAPTDYFSGTTFTQPSGQVTCQPKVLGTVPCETYQDCSELTLGGDDYRCEMGECVKDTHVTTTSCARKEDCILLETQTGQKYSCGSGHSGVRGFCVAYTEDDYYTTTGINGCADNIDNDNNQFKDCADPFCKSNTLCAIGGGCAVGYVPDINGDMVTDIKDANIILAIQSSKSMNCGEDGAVPCKFDLIQSYVCEDGSFRTEGYHGFSSAGQTLTCPLGNMDQYRRGGQ